MNMNFALEPKDKDKEKKHWRMEEDSLSVAKSIHVVEIIEEWKLVLVSKMESALAFVSNWIVHFQHGNHVDDFGGFW
jgi:hypothetical protein